MQYSSRCNPSKLHLHRINGVVVTWVVAIDPPGVRFPLNAIAFLSSPSIILDIRLDSPKTPGSLSPRCRENGEHFVQKREL